MDQTPLMKQYLEIKKDHPDSLLLFRVGDFYEMFFDDAVWASKVLNIALTSRDKSKEHGVPLCGIPYHALNNYLSKLIKAGYQVALCEQMEDPRMAKGIVKREVVRVISPGTLVESELLEGSGNNFFASVYFQGNETAGLAYIDISTGDFNYAGFEGEHCLSDLCNELYSLVPRELLLPEINLDDHRINAIVINPHWKIHRLPNAEFNYERSYAALRHHFKNENLSHLIDSGQKAALCAAGTLLSYLTEMVKTPLTHVTQIKQIRSDLFMLMDHSTHRSLELTQNSYNGKKEHSLLWIFDKTDTSMGGRKLKQWLSRPLIHPEEIQRRLDAVEFFYNHFELSQQLKGEFKSIHDIERIISRITLNSCNGRDFIALKNSLIPFKRIQKQFHIPVPLFLEKLLDKWDNLEDIYHLIDASISEEPPITLKDGSLIKQGYSSELDDLRSLGFNMKTTLARMEREEREKTGVDSLKIRYNQVAGYYIEVPKGKVSRVPDHYQRKQTLTNAERYTIPMLLEFETKIRESEKQIKEIEYSLFEKIRDTLSKESSRILAMADTLASIDLLNTFSVLGRDLHYVRPVISSGSELKILEGRHPVIELILPPGQFVPNDIFLDHQNAMMIITGPNMAGKSTIMRQVALTVIMAQMGSFVPAMECTVGIVDKLFTRIGAADYLTQGQSTFMVEMMEAAHILNSATSKSLIILDEIGRGTSTYDGISIAWAIAEYILKNLKTRTLFATHYLELTGLPLTWDEAKNHNISVKEWNDEIIFLRKIVSGIADRSYGIQVARLAGIPSEVVNRAKEILYNLEGEALDPKGLPKISHSRKEPERSDTQSDLFLSRKENFENQAIEIIENTDLLNLTPLEALNLIHQIKLILNKKSAS
ncbi:MAG: DNA mismatch repair protein MutS [Nitrospiria bacterium]